LADEEETKMSAIGTTVNFNALAGAKFVLLTTYRKNGAPVPTPVCHSVENGIVYLTTQTDTGKAKRIRNQSRALISACDMKGKPTGPVYEASARVLTRDEAQRVGILKESRLVGETFRRSARAHWIVKPIQLWERLLHRTKFVAIAVESAQILGEQAADRFQQAA